jgi:hypothetical protein
MIPAMHVGETTTIQLTATNPDGSIFPIQNATLLTMILSAPNGVTQLNVVASFSTDGSDGNFQYTTLTTDLSMPGTWVVQGFVTGTSFYHPTSEYEFPVYSNL